MDMLIQFEITHGIKNENHRLGLLNVEKIAKISISFVFQNKPQKEI